MDQTNASGYRLGLPAWAYPGWRGVFFDDKPSPLASYASVFNAVEGNTTFYRVPDEASVTRWCEAVVGTDLQFSFKLPGTITHERQGSMEDLERFLNVIRPLGSHLGPLLIQFPAWAGPEHMVRFEPAFERIRAERGAVIEVRHPIFFSEPSMLEELLERHRMGRVMLDSRALYQGDISHPDVIRAVHEKPDVPVLKHIYNQVAFIRLILHPDGHSNERWINEWVGRVATMMSAGVAVTMMVHCPDNGYCPPMALDFHNRLRALTGAAASEKGVSPPLAALPSWPIPQQSSLF